MRDFGGAPTSDKRIQSVSFWWSHIGLPGETVAMPPGYDPKVDQVVGLPYVNSAGTPCVQTYLVHWVNGKTSLPHRFLPGDFRMGHVTYTVLGPVIPVALDDERGQFTVARVNWLYPLWRIWLPVRRVGRFFAGWWQVNAEYARRGGWRS